jgi:hypothetical protein
VSSRFVVGPEQVHEAGDDVDWAAREVADLADAVGTALRAVAVASGGGRLADAAWQASAAWPGGVRAVAEAGSALGRATHDAAEAYRLVEQQQALRLGGGAVSGGRP